MPSSSVEEILELLEAEEEKGQVDGVMETVRDGNVRILFERREAIANDLSASE